MDRRTHEAVMRLFEAHCLKCGHHWIIRTPMPKVCPKCHSTLIEPVEPEEEKVE